MNAAAVLTPGYTADFAEISALGCDSYVARSPEQTEIALFGMDSSPDGWNRIARTRAWRESCPQACASNVQC